jgi:hypothetical protein
MISDQHAAAGNRPPRRTKRYLLVLACIAAAVFGYLVVPGNRSAPPPSPKGSAPEAPVEVTARYQPPGASIGEGWWQQLPAPVASLGPPAGADCPRMWEWSRTHGGVDRGWSDVAVTIRAHRPVSLVVLAASSRLVSSRPPVPGQTLLCVPGREPYMGGEYVLEHGMQVGFLVDRDGASYDFRESGGGVGSPIALGFGEINQLSFRAFAHACDCTWRIEVEMLIDGQRHHFILDDADSGKPFHTIAPPLTPGDPATNIVWCAPEGQGRLTSPARRDCPIPVVYETPLY